MKIPAPDTAVLLIKMELAACTLSDEHSDSVLEDAKRLLGPNSIQ